VSELSDKELIYLRSAANQKWYSVSPFDLDQSSLKLIMSGHLTLNIYYNDWKLTALGRAAISRS
jgi:hypothetical protein